MPRIASIDLTSSNIEIQETPVELVHRWLGGRGLGAAILSERVGREIDPLAPENCMIFSTGPFNGTTWPAASRFHVTFKSPATQAYGYANAGGHFGPELRRAGYDALVITGQAPSPVFLRVTNEEICILPAGDLWGQPTSLVEDRLRQEAGGRVAAIGPAGENLVTFAAIINDGGRAAARSGPGAVMGSKRLKAIQVIAGNAKFPMNPEFARLAKGMSQRVIRFPESQGLMNESTLFLMAIKNRVGDLPAKNHQLGQVPFIQNLDSKGFSKYVVDRRGCAVCSLRCARESAVPEGEYAAQIEGPEYETTDSFGPMCWNSNPQVVIRANELCNDYGLDTISTGVTIAFAMECHQRGLLNDAEFSLEWGDPATILGLTEKIGQREGLGELLAEGTLRAARRIGGGAEDLAMQVKGLEIPRQEPRIAKSFGLGHATSNRGADHLYGLPGIDLAGNWEAAQKIFPAEILPVLMDTADESYKADVVVYGENFCAIIDSLGLCKFTTAETYCILPADLAEGLQMLGWSIDEVGLFTIGERIVNLERLYNQRHGLDRKDDHLPARFTREPLPVFAYTPGPVDGSLVESGEPIMTGQIHNFDAMLDRYYKLRGWDDRGIPTLPTLERLGLEKYHNDHG
ncbi:MAG TPA: aldehyde ferredoxin oxidoreductase family protein [Anaerolineaceae bacterium]|nr:aldehyde ferredoxin oxidoreductase family protein [Anaerolineaceae bacterium]